MKQANSTSRTGESCACCRKNGRETYDVIGERLGLFSSAVLRRVKRLEEAGVIDHDVALVRPEAA